MNEKPRRGTSRRKTWTRCSISDCRRLWTSLHSFELVLAGDKVIVQIPVCKKHFHVIGAGELIGVRKRTVYP